MTKKIAKRNNIEGCYHVILIHFNSGKFRLRYPVFRLGATRATSRNFYEFVEVS